jgi:hypothetical protein
MAGSAPPNRSTWVGYTQALLSERVRPRPPPSNRTTCTLKVELLTGWSLELECSGWNTCGYLPHFDGAAVPQFITPILSGFYSTGAAEDGRAPAEELACNAVQCFCSTGAAEDGRAPAEELACRRSKSFCSTGAAEDRRAPAEELAFRRPTNWHVGFSLLCKGRSALSNAYLIFRALNNRVERWIFTCILAPGHPSQK